MKGDQIVNGPKVYHMGKDWKRSHRCGELGPGIEGEDVTVAGWVRKVREFGELTFLDLWDRTGLVQAVVEAHTPELHDLIRSLRAGDVIALKGRVRLRPDDMVNRDMVTGEIEIEASAVEVFNRSKVPPFNVSDKAKANDDLRLRYRYLDLRRDSMQSKLQLRHELVFAVREHLSGKGFLEVETPLLVRRTPEGARDYLVPSRLHEGKFYALPQSPQLYKQILMVSGVDRYFQLARCLRDEDLRADRQPEHTQIDIEMSFISEDDVFALAEMLMRDVFSKTLGIELEIPFERIDYDDAMLRYGTDKPDLRFDLEISDCGDLFRESGFDAFRSVIDDGGVVRAISFEKGIDFSKSQIKKLEKSVKESGARGLAWIRLGRDSVDSPIARFLSEKELDDLRIRFLPEDVNGTLLLLVAGECSLVERSMGGLRTDLGNNHLLDGSESFKFLWVNRFPLFEKGDDGAWQPAHHIFSMPLEQYIDTIEDDPGRVRGHLYDLVCNGTELGSGSIRVHERQLQEKLMAIIGIDRDEAEKKFGFLLEAFEFGAPPHGGIAIGVDRLAMVMAGEKSIRDFIAFPKTLSAKGLMEGAPSDVEPELLDELHIGVVMRNDKE